MPRRIPADEAASNWQQGMAASTDKINRGIDRVQGAPGQKAAAKRDKYVAGVNDSVDKWARNVASVSEAEWKEAAKAGSSRVAEGARLKQGKYADRVAPVFAHMDSVLSRVDSMPDNSLEQRIQKSAEFQRGMAQYRTRR